LIHFYKRHKNVGMKVVFLGTASCFPTPTRGVSCTALQLDDGQVWLFDCGEGSQIQLQKSSIKPGKITKIFITHLHGDHLYGLPGLLCTLGNGLDPATGHNTVIELYGPTGIRKFVTTALGLSRSPLVFSLSVIEIVPTQQQYPADWDSWKVDHHLQEEFKLPQECGYRKVECNKDEFWPLLSSKGFKVNAAALEHRIPSFGFCVRESDGAGSLDADKLLGLGIKPGPIYGKLKAGKTVEHEGMVLEPSQFIGSPVKGREIVIFGDTCESSQILKITKAPDLFIHESTNENALKEQCIQYGHSTPAMAADIAIRAKAAKLVLFHLSPRYKPVGEPLKKEGDYSASTLLAEARDYVQQQNSGLVVEIAHDLMEIEIPKKNKV